MFYYVPHDFGVSSISPGFSLVFHKKIKRRSENRNRHVFSHTFGSSKCELTNAIDVCQIRRVLNSIPHKYISFPASEALINSDSGTPEVEKEEEVIGEEEGARIF